MFPTELIVALCIGILSLVWLLMKNSKKSSVLITNEGRAKEALAARGAILFCGPTGSGKTALLHQLAFGVAPVSLSSIHPIAIHKHLHRDEGSLDRPKYKLMDCPGASQFRKNCIRLAGECSAIVLVIDATGGLDQIRSSAATLYDLFTDSSVLKGAPRLLIVGNKVDVPGAVPIAHLRTQLEVELERLKKSRATVSTAEDSADIASNEANLLLGSVDEPFSFSKDSPVSHSWCTCVSSGKAPQLDSVVSFIRGNSGDL